MRQQKRIHSLYKEWIMIRKRHPDILLECLIGKYQYLFSTKRGTISCVLFNNYFRDEKDFWEIFPIKGKRAVMRTGCMRFKTFEEAKEAAREILE